MMTFQDCYILESAHGCNSGVEYAERNEVSAVRKADEVYIVSCTPEPKHW